MKCPFCGFPGQPSDYHPFITKDQKEMVDHIYTIHDLLTPKDILKELVSRLASEDLEI